MMQCQCCKNYVGKESRFCPYCGNVRKVEFDKEFELIVEDLEVEKEAYNYRGEERSRYVFYWGRDKVSSLVPDFSAQIERAWLVGDDKIIFLTIQRNIVKLRTVGINKKSSVEICELPWRNTSMRGEMKFMRTEDGRYLLCKQENGWKEKKTFVYLICGRQVVTYSVDAANVSVDSLYADNTIGFVGQDGEESYVAAEDGSVQTVSSMYPREELCRWYKHRCLMRDRYVHPEMIDQEPKVCSERADLEKGEITVTLRYGDLGYHHEDSFDIKIGLLFRLQYHEEEKPAIMKASEWKKEEAAIRMMEKWACKDDPKRKRHEKLYAFYNLKENYLYGTGLEEQFLYDRKNRTVCFIPCKEYGSEEAIVACAEECAKQHPEKFLVADDLECMHLLDSVTEKLIRTHEE